MKARLPFLVVLLLPPAVRAEMVTLTPSKDTTIFQNNGNNSLGGGTVIFAGTNAASSPRRALLAFDLVGAIPALATIDSVQLTLVYSSFGGGGGGGESVPNVPISLHRLTSDWGEGSAGSGTGAGGAGQGFAASTGDATWTQNFFNDSSWTSEGGDFASTPSATTAVGGSTLNIPFQWGSTASLVADVQGWLDHPETNFGWTLLGSEAAAQTFRQFWSREAATSDYVPTLTVRYTAVPEESSIVMIGLGIIGGALARRRRRSTRG